MDDNIRLERRRSLATACGYAIPSAWIALAGWVSWDRLSYPSLREALTLWPATALIAGIAAIVLLQLLPQTPRNMPGISFYGVAAAVCWLVAWTQPTAGLYMSAALAGAWAASRLQRSTKPDASAATRSARADD